MFARRHDDWVEGEFEVTSNHVLDVDGGFLTVQVSGRLCVEGTYGAVVRTIRVQPADQEPPLIGARIPARWRRQRPEKHEIRWGRGEGTWAAIAAQERAKRARNLGIDPADLDAGILVPPAMSQRDALLWWATNAAPLPDGVSPVQVEEAEELKRRGESADATILAIDYLRFWPGTAPDRHASIANVAVQVTRRDGSSYRAIARFGFRTAQRRQQIGYTGAVVPVRIDPEHPDRLTIDTDRLLPRGQEPARGSRSPSAPGAY